VLDWEWITKAASTNGVFAIGFFMGIVAAAGAILKIRNGAAPGVTEPPATLSKAEFDDMWKDHDTLRRDHDEFIVRYNENSSRIRERVATLEERTKGL
jgi:hypothetical protein